MDTTQRAQGKVVIITGAGSGMGAAHASLLAQHGAHVVVTDVNREQGSAVARDIGNGNSTFMPLDVSDYDSWTEVANRTVELYGTIDVLINNAGIAKKGDVDSLPADDWEDTLRVDLSGAFFGMKACVPTMKEMRNGSIINISSIAGVQGFKGSVAYSTAKWGLVGLTKTSAMDLGEFGIRVNTVHPGSIETPMTSELTRGIGQIPLGRVGKPEEVSYLVLHLASDESRFTTGSTFVVDGGETAGNNIRGMV